MKAPEVDKIPAWVAYSGVSVVGGVSLVVLAYYQHLLGVRAGMPEALSWSLSIGLDWGSAVAGVFWFFGVSTLKTWGRWTAVGLLAGSTTGSCVAWGLTSGWEWAPLGVVHPCVFFLMAKLLTLWQAQRSQAVHVQEERPPRKPAKARSGRPTGKGDDEERAAAGLRADPPTLSLPPLTTPAAPVVWAHREVLAGRSAGWRRILGEFPTLKEYGAKKVADEVRDNPPAHTTNGHRVLA